MSGSSSDHVTVTFRTGSSKTVAMPAGTFEISLPQVFNPAGQNRDFVQLKDGNDNWELLHTMQRNQEWGIELHLDGVAYSALAANFWSMVKREGIYVSDSYIDPGGKVWSLRVDFTFTVDGVSRTLVLPSNVPVGDMNISPGGNKTPFKFMMAGTTDPYWTT